MTDHDLLLAAARYCAAAARLRDCEDKAVMRGREIADLADRGGPIDDDGLLDLVEEHSRLIGAYQDARLRFRERRSSTR